MPSVLNPSPTRITLFRGDTHQVVIFVSQQDPANPTDPTATIPVVVTGATAKLSGKNRTNDSAYLFQLSGTVLDGTNGKLSFTFIPATTSALAPGYYAYDVQVTLTTGEVYTVVRDQVLIREDVTTT